MRHNIPNYFVRMCLSHFRILNISPSSSSSEKESLLPENINEDEDEDEESDRICDYILGCVDKDF